MSEDKVPAGAAMGANPPAGRGTPAEVPNYQAGPLLAAIVQSSEDAVVSKTLQGVVTSWNASAERLFGFTAQEMIGESITKIIPQSLQHEEAQILAKIQRGDRIERYETTRVRKDGQLLEISLTVSPVLDEAG